MKKPGIIVGKLHANIDEELGLQVMNCKPNEKITLKAKMCDDEGKVFESMASFITNEHGSVSLSEAKPVEGSYDEIDPDGLFWSMEDVQARHGSFFVKMNADPVKVDLSLEISGEILDQVQISRHFYTFLTLAYFGTEGVPKDLESIPLEYFEKATHWLKNHPAVNEQVSVMGFSRGGELALLLGAIYDEYKSVIAVSPSSYVTAGMKNDMFAPISSWTHQGKALDYMKFSYPPSMIFSMLHNWMLKRPASFLAIWDRTMRNEEKIEQARIRVENIRVPVLTVSGSDDQLWPSEKFVKRMKKHLPDEVGPHTHLFYEGAGHFLAFPYCFPSIPSNVVMQVDQRMSINFGGSKAANARATIDSWKKIRGFLRTVHT